MIGCENMAESIMLDKAKDFAVEIINMCKLIKETKRESVLTNQLMRSGTSIGANIHESKYAHGTADFISKMQIALKECYESEYWLELLNRTGYIDDEQYKLIINNCGQIRRMYFSRDEIEFHEGEFSYGTIYVVDENGKLTMRKEMK